MPAAFEPLVTIVTPAYQQAGYIRRCVESVLAQTYARWELVVVDDGSTDGTPDVVEAYGDPRIRCIRLPHRGLGALADTYNAALSRSSGELVAILEGDDLWPADKLALQVPGFEDGLVALSWGAGNLVDESGQVIETVRRVECEGDRRAFSAADVLRRLALGNFLTPSVTVMVRRAELDAIGGFTQLGTGLFVDLPTWLRLAAHSRGPFLYLDHVLGCWRRHAAQTTARNELRMFVEHAEVVRELAKLVGEPALEQAGLPRPLIRESAVQGAYYSGLVAFGEGRRSAALARHLDALKQARSWRWRKRAALGALSAVCGVDLTGKVKGSVSTGSA